MPDILIIDDDEDFTRLVVPQLELQGYEVRIARSGVRAMALVDERAPDAVLLDGLLPDTNGIVWLTKFRQKFPQTPVWFITAFRFAQEAKSHARLTKELNAKVLSKPIQVQKLIDEVRLAVMVEDLPEVGDAELISELEAEFSAALPARLTRLREAVQRFVSTPNDDSYREALLEAHRLHGTAGMYGMDALGERAGDLEKTLRLAAPAEGRVDQELIARAGAMVAGFQAG